MELKTLLHPHVVESSYAQFQGGHFRDAVLNSIIGVFDYIRGRTELKLDGSDLINEVFSTHHPRLILSELDTKSGENDQVGFMEILRGTYRGIRNPKAHSLASDFTEESAAQYLVLASLLVRRIEQARIAYPRSQGWYIEQEPNTYTKKVLRFYPDRTVIIAAFEDPSPATLSNFNIKRAEAQDFPRGQYDRRLDSIRFSLRSKHTEIAFEGHIEGEQLKLEVENDNRYKSQYTFAFLPAPAAT